MKVIFPQHIQVEYSNLSETYRRRWIYVLLDPRTKEIGYVGQTITNPRIRMSNHIYQAGKRNTPARIWIQEILDRGDSPIMQVVGIHGRSRDTEEPMGQSEREWMRKLIVSGCNLTNDDHVFRAVRKSINKRTREKRP